MLVRARANCGNYSGSLNPVMEMPRKPIKTCFGNVPLSDVQNIKVFEKSCTVGSIYLKNSSVRILIFKVFDYFEQKY